MSEGPASIPPLVVEFDVTVGGGAPTSTTVYVTNNGTVFGELDNDAVEFLDLTITDGDWEATLDLDFDGLTQSQIADLLDLPLGTLRLPMTSRWRGFSSVASRSHTS